MSSRGTAAAVAVIGGAALAAGLTAWRVLSTEKRATVVPLQRLARKYRSKSRAGLVPAAAGASCRHPATAAWLHGGQCIAAQSHLLPCPSNRSMTGPHTTHAAPRCSPGAGAPQGDLSVLPSQYPAVRRDDSVVEVLHGETIAGGLRWANWGWLVGMGMRLLVVSAA